MSGDGLAPAVLCAAVGLALAFARSPRALRLGLVAFALAGLACFLVKPPPALSGAAVSVGWVAVLVAAGCVHQPRGLSVGWTVGLGLLGGGLIGVTAAGLPGLLTAAPWVLMTLPGAWLVSRRRGLVLKVVLSWLAAAAALSLGLHMTPTLGFEPDHMG